MRIVYLLMSYPMAVQPWAISDIRALERQGHHVHVYALRGRSHDNVETARRYGLTLPRDMHPGARTWVALLRPESLAMTAFLVGLVLRRLLLRPLELAKTLVLLPRLVEIADAIRRRPPDVVHAFWGHYPAIVLLLGERFFPDAHRSLFLGNYDLTPRPFALAPDAAAVADSIWTLAEANLPLLRDIGVPMEKVTVARRGIPLDLAERPVAPRVPGRICTAANFQKEKNIDLVIRSFAHVLRRRGDATLVVAGDGAERGGLVALVAELDLGPQVTFTGLLSREDIFTEMQRAEVFVFLSTKPSERLPNVVMEAMLAQCFCVVSRTDDIEELIEPRVTGEIVDPPEPGAVAERIAAALEAPDRMEVGHRAAERIRERFSADAQMAIYADGWARALAHRPATRR